MFFSAKPIILLFFTCSVGILSAQNKLVLSEVSQGASGVKEYVELVVTGNPTCTTPVPCLDIRKYIIDDNNGQFASGSGSGIANGAFRFANNSFWSCIPQGTLIVIYNDGDKNSSIPANDVSLTDGNCRIVIPVSSVLLEYTNVGPSTASSAYSSNNADWTAGGGNWSPLGMANGGDSFQVRKSAAQAAADFSVSWGNNSSSTTIYFTGSSSTKVYSLADAVSTDFTIQANWQSAAVAGNETPGSPNSTKNAKWLGSLNPSCGYVPPLAITLTPTQPACSGNCDGSISSSVSGGSTPYTYSWTGGTSGPSVSGLCAGTYTLEVTDANGCIKHRDTTLLNPAAITVTLTATPISCHAACDGTITSAISGGTAPYTYSWSGGQSTPSLTGLCAGTYTLTVTDAKGCTQQKDVTLTDPPAITVTLNSTLISCNAGCDGTVTSSVSGGVAPYTYSWSGGESTPSLSNLCAGTYTLTVSDANGCTQQKDVTLTDPPAIIVTLNPTPISCNTACDGSVSSSVSGGVAPYTYSWAGGESTPSLSNLCAGTYTLTVSDANGCTQQKDVTIADPPVVTVTLDATPVSCNATCNGAIVSSISGGMAPYTYSWSNSGTSPGITGLCPGTYDLLVHDANGCIGQAEVIVDPAAILQLTIQATDENCASACDGTATVSVTGGTAPYTYSWSNSGATAGISGLCPGTYDISVEDENGCTSQAQAVINPGTGLQLTVQKTDESCPSSCNGTATVSVTGGVAPYTYSWSNSGSAAGITGLCPGTYAILVKDANGCSGQSQAIINPGTGLQLTVQKTDESCPSSCDGTATVSVTGGTAPYTYSWSNSGATAGITGLCPGTYDILVQDANGCSGQSQAVINAGTGLQLTTQKTDESCASSCDGTATVSVTGGVAPYTYNWSNSGATAGITALCPGTYDILVQDANGCSGQSQAIVGAGVSVGNAQILTTAEEITAASFKLQLDAQPAGGSWTSNCMDCLSGTGLLTGSPTHTSDSLEICYSVNQACWNPACLKVEVKNPVVTDDEFSLYIPNAVTLNGDRLNDELTIFINKGRVNSTEIYNRWGELIFTLGDGDLTWDLRDEKGSFVQDGVYTYAVYYTKDGGNTEKSIGHVNVLH